MRCDAMRCVYMGSLFGRISLLSCSSCGSFVWHDMQGHYGESVGSCGRGKGGLVQLMLSSTRAHAHTPLHTHVVWIR